MENVAMAGHVLCKAVTVDRLEIRILDMDSPQEVENDTAGCRRQGNVCMVVRRWSRGAGGTVCRDLEEQASRDVGVFWN